MLYSISCLVRVLLTVALVLQSTGQLCVLLGVRVVARVEARTRVRSAVPPRECAVFVVDPSTTPTAQGSLSWMEDDEFVVAGMMFDVVRRYDSADVSVIVAVRDGMDSWWHGALNQEQDRQSRQRSKSAPIHDLITKMSSLKAIATDAYSLDPLLTDVLRSAPQCSEPVCAGYTPPVDRPPLMS